MSSALKRSLLLLYLLLTGPAWADTGASPDTLALRDAKPSFEVLSPVQTWVENGSQATIGDVSRPGVTFTASPAARRHPLDAENTLWIKLRVMRAATQTAHWTLNVPLPYADEITLYQRDAEGHWSGQLAGDTIAKSEWTKPGLYPDFALEVATGEPQEIYLRVRNFKPMQVPIRIETQRHRDMSRGVEMLLLGLAMGLLMAASGLSFARFVEHRDAANLWVALFGVLIFATVAQINGLLDKLLWADLPALSDYANSTMPLIASGGTLLFTRALYAGSTHYHRYDLLMCVAGWATIALVLGYALLERQVASVAGNIGILISSHIALAAALMSWRGGSAIWRWILLATVPTYLCMIKVTAESLGLIPTMWEMRYLASASISLSLIVMVYAFSRVTHDRNELHVRTKHLPTQDALTGLLNPEEFNKHLLHACHRAKTDREPVALALVQIANYESIRRGYGDRLAEQALLRAVVKLQRVVRDIDPAGRVGTARFAVLFEGALTEQALNQRLVQLVGSGLIPLPGLEPAIGLTFHVACVLLHQSPVLHDTVVHELETLLAEISPKSRRPIRFLESAITQAQKLDASAGPA